VTSEADKSATHRKFIDQANRHFTVRGVAMGQNASVEGYGGYC
jgi:hypothetical protein